VSLPPQRRAAPAGPIHRRPGLTLYRLIAKEALTPTLVALFGLTTVVLTQNLLGLSDLFVNRGLSGGTVSLIAFYQAVPTAALMLPFAVLMGCLVALGRMGADLEILALEASSVTTRNWLALRCVREADSGIRWTLAVSAVDQSRSIRCSSVRSAPFPNSAGRRDRW
jgi:hypothetical protein